MKNKVINSPIRWAGSKKKILNEMLNFFDKTSKIYIEPFLGSGVVLINLINNIEEFDFEEIYVNDINSNIINFYKLLKDDYEYAEKQIKKGSEHERETGCITGKTGFCAFQRKSEGNPDVRYCICGRTEGG